MKEENPESVMKKAERIEAALDRLDLNWDIQVASTGSVYITIPELNNLKIRISDHSEAHFTDIPIDPETGMGISAAIKKIEKLAAHDSEAWEEVDEYRATFSAISAKETAIATKEWQQEVEGAKRQIVARGINPTAILSIDRRKPGWKPRLAIVMGMHKATFKRPHYVRALYQAARELRPPQNPAENPALVPSVPGAVVGAAFPTGMYAYWKVIDVKTPEYVVVVIDANTGKKVNEFKSDRPGDVLSDMRAAYGNLEIKDTEMKRKGYRQVAAGKPELNPCPPEEKNPDKGPAKPPGNWTDEGTRAFFEKHDGSVDSMAAELGKTPLRDPYAFAAEVKDYVLKTTKWRGPRKTKKNPEPETITASPWNKKHPIKNPAKWRKKDIKAAVEVIGTFKGNVKELKYMVAKGRSVLVQIADAVAVTYDAAKHGEPEKRYIHPFEKAKLFWCPDNGWLVIAGKGLRITREGIEG